MIEQNLTPDRAMADRFLTLLDEDAEHFTFATFDDCKLSDGKTRKDPSLTRELHGALDEHEPELARLNQAGAGVFVTIQRTDLTGRKAENIVGVRAVFQEQDRAGCPELPTAPHIVVESSPGKHHRYILLADCPLGGFGPLQERLVQDYGSDPNAKDIARVLRLPGFYHQKDPAHPHLVRITSESGELPLPYAEAVRLFPPVVRKPKPPPADTGAPADLAEVQSALSVLNPDMPYMEWLSVGMALHDWSGGSAAGLEVWGRWSSNGDSYRQGECTYKWGTFGTGGGVTIRSVFHMARDAGWQGEGGNDTEPTPLPELPPVDPFDYSLLPDKLAPWVQDIAERMQCPPDYVAVGAMVNLAAVLGRRIGIRPQERTDWTVIANLWGLIVGRPGLLKSPSLEATSGPLDRLIAEAQEAFHNLQKEAGVAKAMAELKAATRKKAAKDKLSKDPEADITDLLKFDDVDAPVLRRYRTNDSNAASLGEVLRQNPNGVLVFRDEMTSLLKWLDREDNQPDRGFYLSAWNGSGSYTLDRIGRGLNLHIEACCISLLGGTQPGKLSEYIGLAVKGGTGDDGLIQRFGMMVWPDAPKDWRNVDRYPETAAKNAAYEVFDRLDKLSAVDLGAEQDFGYNGFPEGIPYLRFDRDALKWFAEWRSGLETRLRSGELHPAMESHLAKYRKLVPGLALLIHLADDGVGPVTTKPTLKALAWAEYLETHAKRCYGSITQPVVTAAKAILNKISRGDLKSPFNAKSVWRPGWAGLADSKLVGEALELLVDYGHLKIQTVPTNGKSATLYHVVEATA